MIAPQNLYKIFIPPKIPFFLTPPPKKSIQFDNQNFDPQNGPILRIYEHIRVPPSLYSALLLYDNWDGTKIVRIVQMQNIKKTQQKQ